MNKISKVGFTMTHDLFQLALNRTQPWFVSDINFDVESKKLDV